MSSRKTRVRFAPSPTGPLHMGGVRTALYNYLYARQHGGAFVLRIEDTDSGRFVPGAEQYIIEALAWCGITPDEGVENGRMVEEANGRHPYGPYRQSQRRGIYRKYAQQLIEAGCAYYAFDTPEELAEKRAEAEKNKQTFIYNQQSRRQLRNSLTLPEDEVKRLLENTTGWTIRFKMPENEVVKMDDMIRGHVEVNTETLDDKVLWKRADELPTYHLANIVDDHLMEITDVIRGEEWLPSLPLHYMLYKAFGWEDTMPRFAHLPLLLKPVGNGKLSKRDGDKMGFPVFPLKWVNAEGESSRGYREDGYFPEAFVNMLAMLGWNPGTEQEIFSLEQLVEAFSLDKVNKAGAKFNPEKARWYNREYLRMKSVPELARAFMPILREHGVEAPEAYVQKAISVIKDRATFVADFWTAAPYLFVAPTEYNAKDVEKFWKSENFGHLPEVRDHIAAYTGPMEVASIAESLEGFIKGNEWPLGKVMNCLRLSLTGAASGLGIAEIIYTTGIQETVKRINKALDTL